MMKTKLTLFVTVLAAALFLGGCASVPKPDVANVVKWNGHWYVVLPEKIGFKAAVIKCERLGGHLAYVESEAENKFITGLLGGGSAWLGGTDEENEGEWLWLNGKPIINALWKKGQPGDGRAANSISIQGSVAGRNWHDQNQPAHLPVVCEWE